MHPVIVDLFGVRIQGYGLMIGIGLVLGYLAVQWEVRRSGPPRLAELLPSLVLWIALAAFVGGKLFFVFMYPDTVSRILRDHGLPALAGEGFVFQGSVLLALPTALWRLRVYRLPVLVSLDRVTLGVPALHALARVGCFMAGCCYGCRTDGPLAVTFPGDLVISGVPVHPVQLYEAVGEVAVFAILWLAVRKRVRFAGQVLLSYLFLYACLRLGTEFFRGDGNPVAFGEGGRHHAGDPPEGLTTQQVISLVMAPVCLLLLARGFRRAPGS